MRSRTHKGSTIAQRVNIIGALFLFFVLVLCIRFASLELVDANGRIVLKSRASASAAINDLRERGEIFLKDRFAALMPLAINKTSYIVSADPRIIADKTDVAETLAGILQIPADTIAAKLGKENDPYEVIAPQVDDAVAQQIAQLRMPGIQLAPQESRYYPYQRSASHLTGFLGVRDGERAGQYGLEGFYDTMIRDKGDVAKLILSVDPNIQFTIEQELKSAVEKWDAEDGSVIVMEPATGRILGMANVPAFDPNDYAHEKNIGVFVNTAISSQFELGSVFKPITMAAGLNENVITPDTTYEDKGIVVMGHRTIQNFDNKAHGVQTMTQVLEKSLNTGVVFVEQKIAHPTMRTYIQNFGFGQKTSIDLQGEVVGDLRNLEKGDIEFATAAFGQGITVTPLQMLTAIAAIANKGVLMKPHVVDTAVLRDGTEKKNGPVTVRSVITPATAESLTKMLVSTVENGYDKAKVHGYFVAGKTGTAQIADSRKKGYLAASDTIHTFVGYAPAYHPQFAVLLTINRPKGVNFASSSLAPTFATIMSYLLTYYEVPPDFK